MRPNDEYHFGQQGTINEIVHPPEPCRGLDRIGSY
jgi:hypothetical protein